MITTLVEDKYITENRLKKIFKTGNKLLVINPAIEKNINIIVVDNLRDKNVDKKLTNLLTSYINMCKGLKNIEKLITK